MLRCPRRLVRLLPQNPIDLRFSRQLFNEEANLNWSVLSYPVLSYPVLSKPRSETTRCTSLSNPEPFFEYAQKIVSAGQGPEDCLLKLQPGLTNVHGDRSSCILVDYGFFPPLRPSFLRCVSDIVQLRQLKIIYVPVHAARTTVRRLDDTEWNNALLRWQAALLKFSD